MAEALFSGFEIVSERDGDGLVIGGVDAQNGGFARGT